MLNNLIAYLTVAFMDVTEREEGQGLVEYALILAFVSILSIAALTALSGGINGVFSRVTSAL
jgi:pilus assembly protein Flp/PilA